MYVCLDLGCVCVCLFVCIYVRLCVYMSVYMTVYMLKTNVRFRVCMSVTKSKSENRCGCVCMSVYSENQCQMRGVYMCFVYMSICLFRHLTCLFRRGNQMTDRVLVSIFPRLNRH